MNTLRTRLVCAALLCATAGLAHAAGTDSTAPAEGATAPAAATTALQLPKLALSWHCADKECTQNEKVAPLIEQAYAAAAAKDGYTVSTTDSAAFEITDFRQRPPGVRATLGIFAGKDRLAVHGNWHGKDISASDYSANAIQGMNHLCETVARKVYAGVVAKVREDRSTAK